MHDSVDMNRLQEPGSTPAEIRFLQQDVILAGASHPVSDSRTRERAWQSLTPRNAGNPYTLLEASSQKPL
eukprot:365992-Chlamydomonas_euryale.AAC.2